MASIICVNVQGVCGCDRFTSSSISHVLRTIVKKDGYRGLLRGWLPRMLFHAPAAAICWSTYEGVKSFFQDFNVDSNTAWKKDKRVRLFHTLEDPAFLICL